MVKKCLFSLFQYIQQQIAAQDRLMASQDSRLDMMSETMGTLRNVGGAIGQELDEQAVMLDEFGTEIENAESKLDATMRKMVRIKSGHSLHSSILSAFQRSV